MTQLQFYNLAMNGYTRDEIKYIMQMEQAQAPAPAPAQAPAPAPAPAPVPASVQVPTQPMYNPAMPQNFDILSALRTDVQNLQNSVQRMNMQNISMGNNVQAQTPQDVLASIINPPEPMTQGKFDANGNIVFSK